MNLYQTEIRKDSVNKKLHITRQFQAPKEMVWKAWTTAELLDQWWAPRPYETVTKSLDFKEGGFWLYHMLSPEGDKHWCRLDYLTIVPQDYYTAIDAFCDEEGTPNTDIPQMTWKNTFTSENNETKVTVEISFEREEDMEKIIEMGMKEGFSAALENLDELLAKGN
ncbi:SRPBCC domain-containing protein [uncultured Roseivirga sp.]|uniref:SRPBCC family protein n=1 Tax=uncultured Roseivirga sp. TaxID=543088 RepID=UPI0030D937EC|tara:strand:- start:86638 stop:87135 length:498 start_codon:yes stop_codon:yes gene_type:complete